MARGGLFGHKSLYQRRMFDDYDELARLIEDLRKKHGIERVVFTGGVWDLIHPGHLFYLEKAADQGDLVVVGVDSDELANRRKKMYEINRPVIPFAERSLVLSFLRCVDLITVVRDDIKPIIDAIKPQVLVVSETTGDLPPNKYSLYERDGMEIVPLPPQAPPETVSSTARIRRVVVEGLDISERQMHEAVTATFSKLRSEIM